MKKFVLVMSCALLVLINSCKRSENETFPHSSNNSIDYSSVQDWYNSELLKIKTNPKSLSLSGQSKYLLKPIWQQQDSVQLKNGTKLIIVPAKEFSLDSANIGFLRAFVFLKRDNKVKYGRIVEFYGDINFIKQNKKLLLSSFNYTQITGFNGAIITYDINYRYLRGRQYKYGLMTGAASIQKGVLPASSIKSTSQRHRYITLCGESQTSACYDVFWVTDQGRNWEYLYSFCDNCGEGGAGSGGNGGNSPGPTYTVGQFGLPQSPYDGLTYTYTYPNGRTVEFTYNAQFNAWLLPEVQALSDQGYDFQSGQTFGGKVLTAVAIIATPTLSVPMVLIGVGIIATIYIYEASTYYNATKDNKDLDQCINMYTACRTNRPFNIPCDDCLQYCRSNGYWDFNRCPDIYIPGTSQSQ
ncbi:hypothetical protein GS399_15930 [Pedobacter sp. HMF7647]|uniref:Uncharacterized protein n=1 Tax=Hufsiella arboris TaxID=2695275 RepID=A0A7K1YD12_9SPHI|nr:hypothetical protein [Hufsiella arboris]MXV52465.1 hypothetical protein [Hufsiella arboris]